MTKTEDVTADASFVWPVRVYWEDTDAGGVVYYANYLKFMERARTEWLRARGIDQNRLRERTGVVLVVRELTCEFLKSARLDDELEVAVELASARGARMTLTQTIHRESDRALLISARIGAACLDAERWTPRRLPPELRSVLDQPR